MSQDSAPARGQFSAIDAHLWKPSCGQCGGRAQTRTSPTRETLTLNFGHS
jgi:hypothetical protein